MTIETQFGFNDEPSIEDYLAIEKYLIGLSDFIYECQTPMTIAIQGDWGTGKTTAMRQLKNKLENKNKDEFWQINFNTWQYSQFDLGEQLIFSLIGTILNELENKLYAVKDIEDKVKDAIVKRIKNLRKPLQYALISMTRMGVETFVPYGALITKFADAVQAGKENQEKVEGLKDKYGPNASIELITRMRSDLNEIINEIITLEKDKSRVGPKRIVIYIDDLDRLEPEKAVVLMEAIKVFLDVKNCVFVLAIDFGVVQRGVRAKYGSDFSEEKARAFFDKIIQVPFNLPIGAYQIETLLLNGLKNIAVELPHESEKEKLPRIYADLTEYSVGRNPRAIKRLVNTFGLIKKINEAAEEQTEGVDQNMVPTVGKTRDEHVFALLCMQTAYPEVFAEITRHQEPDKRKERWDEIQEKTENSGDEFLSFVEDLGISEYRKEAFRLFVNKVSELFSEETKDTISEQLFNLALAKAAVTAVGTAENTGVNLSTDVKGTTLMLENERLDQIESEVVRGIAKAFESKMSELIGRVEAGVAKDGHWSYLPVEGSELEKIIGRKRFLELYPRKSAITIMFGNRLNGDQHEIIKDEINQLENGATAKRNDRSNPPISVNEIKTAEAAEKIAELIASYHLEHGK